VLFFLISVAIFLNLALNWSAQSTASILRCGTNGRNPWCLGGVGSSKAAILIPSGSVTYDRTKPDGGARRAMFRSALLDPCHYPAPKAERRGEPIDGAVSVRTVSLLVIFVVVLIAVAALAAPTVMAQFSGAPAQPVGFTHVTHVKQLGLDCTFCHRNVARGNNASIPAVGQCMFCHRSSQG